MADLRQRVYSMLGLNDHSKNSEIGKHSLQEGFKSRTIYDRIKRDEIGLPAKKWSSNIFQWKKLQTSKKRRCESYWR